MLVASSLIAAVGAAGVWYFSPWLESYYVVPFILGLTCLPMIALSDVLQGVARANSWPISALAPTYLTRPLLILAVMGVALVSGLPADARTAILSTIVATYATTLVQLMTMTARVSRGISAGPMRILLREWFVVSLPIFLIESFFFLLTNADVLMVGAFMQPNDVAVYFATVKTLALVHFVYFAVKTGVAQRYAQFTHGDRSKLAEFARETVTLDILAIARHGACGVGNRQTDADAVRPGLRARLSATVSACRGRRRARRRRSGREPADDERKPEYLRGGFRRDARRQSFLGICPDTSVRPVGRGDRHHPLDDVRGLPC